MEEGSVVPMASSMAPLFLQCQAEQNAPAAVMTPESAFTAAVTANPSAIEKKVMANA